MSVVLLILEIFLRICWTPPKGLQDLRFVEYDPLYGWKKIPSISRTYVGDGYSVLESFNSKGLRGLEYRYSNPEHEYRILILGDSQTEGYSVKFQNLFSEVLKKKLKGREDRPYQVINAGTRGYSTDQELLFFQKEGKKYHPDLAILMFSVDDVWYNAQPKLENRYKPFFNLEGGQLKLGPLPVPKPSPPSGIREFLKNNCYLVRFVYNRVSHTDFYAWLVKFKLASVPDFLRTWRTNDDKPVREAWNLTEAILTAFQQEAARSGSRFLIFYVPSPEPIYKNVWAVTRKKYGMLGNQWSPFQDVQELEALCQRNHIDFLNPIPPFQMAARELQKKGESLYYFKDNHWTAEGHGLTGILLKEYIAKNYLEESTNRHEMK